MTAYLESLATNLQVISELSTQDPLDEEALTFYCEAAQSDAIEVMQLIANVESFYYFLNDPLAEDFVADGLASLETFSNAYVNNTPLSEFTNVNQADELVNLILEGVVAAKAFRLQQSLL